MELFACLVSIFCFRKLLKNKLVTLYTDNTNARDWMIRRRSDNPLGNTYLIILELLKYSVECKLSTRWIPLTDNRTADLLSRGGLPTMVATTWPSGRCELPTAAEISGRASVRLANIFDLNLSED